ncbi:MAG TPA: GNAT family N-acetyltransferase, partial [Dongiaceae bacterium]|nr:GNAT family N-acetyltransferase [Dongiaceae bacterium]
LEPENAECHALCMLLVSRLQRWQQAGWSAAAASDGELALEPIGPEHASSLLYQYRDPQIATVSRLDALDTLDDAERWINTEANLPGTRLYAVMHASWGFVGIAGARCADGAAYFYFWIGADFQDRGFGRRSAKLLFDHLARQGITEIFTSVYEHNQRSLTALNRLGFSSLPLTAEAPDDDLLFLYRTTQDSASTDAAQRTMRALCAAIDHPVVFSPER